MESKMIKFTSSCTWLILLFASLVTFSSCEEEYIPDTNAAEQEIVVEGYIEAGEGSLPPYVIITRSIPFISEVNSGEFADLFVRNADVNVSYGNQTVKLTEICLADVPENLKEQVYRFLGLNPDSAAVDICIYADILGQIKREFGQKYDLKIAKGDTVLTASTTIPQFIGLYDFEWQDTPGKPSDTLAELNCKISDPAGENFYRYLTATGKNPRLIPPFTSVTDDAFFDGKDSLLFPLQKAERRGQKFDPETFGYFQREDSVFVKWCTIDKVHFDFWKTRDFAANSGGPFSSYTRIKTNIQGGLGIWGGYAVHTYRLYCPPK